MLKILVADGESAALGAPIAIVGAEGEEITVDATPAAAEPDGDGADPDADEPAVATPTAPARLQLFDCNCVSR